MILLGDNLEGGDPTVSHWCRFGDHIVRGVAQPEPKVVGNTWWSHTVRCIVPPAPASSVRVSVSLNGEQFSAEDLRFAIAPA